LYDRHVTIHLKSDSVSEFAQTFERDILPLLRKQDGYTDEITFVAEDGRDAMGLILRRIAAQG
jgi:hypothetical protein